MIRLLLLAFVLVTAPAFAGEDDAHRPYDEAADAQAMIDEALAAAGDRQVPALIVFGANWCHDSRGFARAITETPALEALLAQHYEVVFVDIGLRHRNLDQAARFGLEAIAGTPALVIAGPDGVVLNADTAGDWRTADDAAASDVEAYLARHAGLEIADRPITAYDMQAAAEAWPAYQSALAAAEEMDDPPAARAYALGMARSMARREAGREAEKAGLRIATADDLAALGVTPADDITARVIERLADIAFDILDLRAMQAEETAAAMAEEAVDER